MRTRKISILAITAAALSLALTACENGDAASSSPEGGSTVTATDTPRPDTAGDKGTSPGTPAQSDQKCTDQIDYSADSRSNAEINSIGEETGSCPPVQKLPSDVKCTDQIDYSADSRSNAEINSIGAETGTCPPVEAE